jgi:hypothetical protein
MWEHEFGTQNVHLVSTESSAGDPDDASGQNTLVFPHFASSLISRCTGSHQLQRSKLIRIRDVSTGNALF